MFDTSRSWAFHTSLHPKTFLAFGKPVQSHHKGHRLLTGELAWRQGLEAREPASQPGDGRRAESLRRRWEGGDRGCGGGGVSG
eukprot:4784170-Pleurochrysis_carterae.AAC.1